MKKFLCVFLSVIVCSLFIICSFAEEELVKSDAGVKAAPLEPVYSASYSSSLFSDLFTFLSDGGYTSRDNAFHFSYPVYIVHSGVSTLADSIYVRDGIAVTVGTFDFISGRSLTSDSPEFYSWLVVSVGVSESDIVVARQGSLFNSVFALSGSIFSVGSSLISFITSSWITIIALVAFLLVLVFGVIRRLVKGV